MRARIVVLAASAGGVHALGEVLSALPGDLPAAVVVVQHLAPHHRSHMAQIMSRHTPLHVKQARDGEALRRGVVYIAPPDRHLLVNPDGTVTLAETELVHFLRPSADLLFESAAAAFGEGVVAVVLTGTGEDGTMGVRAVKKMGGMVIVQDEETAEFRGMPHAAVSTGLADRVLHLDAIGPALSQMLIIESP
jgi:two-component system chemotaxis response regulator CheB